MWLFSFVIIGYSVHSASTDGGVARSPDHPVAQAVRRMELPPPPPPLLPDLAAAAPATLQPGMAQLPPPPPPPVPTVDTTPAADAAQQVGGIPGGVPKPATPPEEGGGYKKYEMHDVQGGDYPCNGFPDQCQANLRSVDEAKAKCTSDPQCAGFVITAKPDSNGMMPTWFKATPLNTNAVINRGGNDVYVSTDPSKITTGPMITGQQQQMGNGRVPPKSNSKTLEDEPADIGLLRGGDSTNGVHPVQPSAPLVQPLAAPPPPLPPPPQTPAPPSPQQVAPAQR